MVTAKDASFWMWKKVADFSIGIVDDCVKEGNNT
jgi:hypothetical protein